MIGDTYTIRDWLDGTIAVGAPDAEAENAIQDFTNALYEMYPSAHEHGIPYMAVWEFVATNCWERLAVLLLAQVYQEPTREAALAKALAIPI